MADKNPNTGGWGGAPQESDTASPRGSNAAGRAGGWGGTPQESDTASLRGSNAAGRAGGWGGAPQESDTGAAKCAMPGEVPVYSVYVLDSLTFNVRRVISDISGEAVIFEVENDGTPYVLKLYRFGVVPNHAVLQRIMEQRGNGLLVDIFAHGVWHDAVTKADYHYEVMQYCAGGSLANLNLAGDEKRLREVVLRMASALDFAHKNGVLHRDVKPANFLFTDKEKTRFVLTDWGLAKTLDEQGRTVTDDGRTKIYAAPEMYTYIPGKPTYVGPKADYYSMGMTLMALWMGEGCLLADETKLVHDKQEETLPYPKRGEMTDHTLGLIKALTRRNPDVRAGFDDIVRWSKGESVFCEPDADDSIAEFKIIFNATQKLIAHTPKELSDMMWANRELAIKYLYSDKLAAWFRDIERPELAMEMEDITEKRFPADRDQGLFAACLTLNPSLPFPFGVGGKTVNVGSLKELADGFASGRLPSSVAPVLTKQAFLMWAASRNAALAGKAMRTPDDGWRILYALAPDRAYDLRPINQSQMASPAHIGQALMDQLSGHAEANELLSAFSADKFPGSRVCAYLKSRGGMYDKQISWVKYCLDIKSTDNKKKFAPYTLRVARMKAAAGLVGGVPPVTIDGHTFASAKDVSTAKAAKLSGEQQNILADWLALSFHEDPWADFKKRSYINRVVDYTDALYALDKCDYSQQKNENSIDALASFELYNQKWRKVKIWRWVGIILGFIPLLIVCCLFIYLTLTQGVPDYSSQVGAFGLVVGLFVGGSLTLGMLGEDYGIVVSGVAGVLAFTLIKFAFYFLGMVVPWFIVGIMLVALFMCSKNLFFGAKDGIEDGYTDIPWFEVVNRYFVGAAFNCFDKVFPSSVPDDYPVCCIDESTEVAMTELPKVRKHSALMLLLAIVGACLCVFWFKGVDIVERVASEPKPSELLVGKYTGKVGPTATSVVFSRGEIDGLRADMVISYSTGAIRQRMIGAASDSLPLILYKFGENDIYLRIDSAYVCGADTIVKGVYLNSLNKLKAVEITKDGM